MIVIIFILFLLAPLLSLPLIILGYLRDKRFVIPYSIMFGVALGLFAYYLQPPESFDLFRHHQVVDELSTYNVDYFIKFLSSTSEPLQSIFSFIIAQFHNHDLLQFSVVALGYSILFYIIGDFAKRNKIKTHVILIVLIFTLASFTCVNFFSGLWNYLAMLVFALAFYLDTFRQKTRFLTYPLYVLAPLIHSSLFMPLAILLIFKIFRERLSFKVILVTCLVFVTPSVLLPLINSVTDIPIFAQLEPMYNAYFLNGSRFSGLYDNGVLVMELLKITLYLGIAFAFKPIINSDKKSKAFVILAIISTLVLVLNSIVLIRFVLLVQFLGAPMVMLYLNDNKRRSFFIMVYIVILSLVFCFYQYLTLKNLNYDPLSAASVFLNINQIFIKE